MSRHENTLSKIQSKPVPSGVKWKELTGLLKYLGYKIVKSGGSRRKFYNKEKDALICCHEPHPQSTVDKGCIRNVVKHLKEKNII